MRHHYGRLLALAAGALLAGAGEAAAGPAPGAGNLTLSATPSSISFQDQHPGLVPVITSAPATISLDVKASGNPVNWQLRLTADTNLISRLSTIAIGNVRVQTSPATAPWVGGPVPLALSPGILLGSGSGNVNQPLTLTFTMLNSWDHAPGNYTATATFSLTAP